jgi:hypothetical protein
MRLESFRNVQTASITVRGSVFSVEIQPDGKVKWTGAVTVEEPAALHAPLDPMRAARARSPSRKRGSR